MESDAQRIDTFQLPEDLSDQLAELSNKLGESPRFLVIAAVEHFTRIPPEQRKAVVMGAARRRK
jgi:hypothetical protein